MIRSSIGQMKSDTATQLYKRAGSLVDAWVKTEKILPTDRDLAFAKMVSSYLKEYGIQIPKDMLATASKELPFVDARLARVAEKLAAVTPTTTYGVGTVFKNAPAPAVVVAAVARQSALEAAKSTARSAAPIAAGLFAAEAVWNLARYANGGISGSDLARRTTRSAASNGGGVAGAAAGAAIGSMFPVVGTAIGAIVGGIVGGVSSGWLVGLAMK